MTRRNWTDAELAEVRRRYPHERTRDLAKSLNRSVCSVYSAAHNMGLHKSAAFMASDASGRVQRGKQDPRLRATQFKPGMRPWNKGAHFTAGGRSAETRFKPGNMSGAAQHNYRPVGSERVSKDGYLERKVTDAGDTNRERQRRWVAVHRLVWVETYGPIPHRHIVRFKPGMHTTEAEEITIDKLELISCAENMRRNSRHTRYPPEVNQIIQLKGALKRKINNRSKQS